LGAAEKKEKAKKGESRITEEVKVLITAKEKKGALPS